MRTTLLSRSIAFALAMPLLLAATTLHANNIQVANAGLTAATATTAQVQFDLSWENSWRTINVNNWDAAWVFVKYRTSTTGPWLHMNLNNTGHVAASGSQVDLGLLTPGAAYNATTNPVVGVFIRRSADGTGTLNLPGTQLQWNFGALGLNYGDIAQIQVFAIEMVYVPQGAFAAGSGGTETNAFTLTTISTAAASTVPAGTGSLGGQAGGHPTGQTAPVATWPNGFSAFYCMKYEVSQQAYVDFLNTLTYTQQVTRTATAPNSAAGTGALISGNGDRSGIDIQTPGAPSTTPALYACNYNNNGTFSEATDGKDVACNYLSFGDLAAYLDWCGLRPMTELEFEKACRGTVLPVANAYTWGTTGIHGSAYGIANDGAANETTSNYSTTLGNANYPSTNPGGPLRVGIFSANSANTGRVSAGASYFGIMELGGNVHELLVNLATANGRGYTGTHGNGSVGVSGNADPASWPASGSDGTGVKGGGWQTSSAAEVRISDRTNVSIGAAFASRLNSIGGRGVRLAL